FKQLYRNILSGVDNGTGRRLGYDAQKVAESQVRMEPDCGPEGKLPGFGLELFRSLTMRILILDTNYDEVLNLTYERDEGLSERSFEDQARAIYDFGFARANFLPLNLCKLGHEAQQFIINCVPLQRRWAREHDVKLPENR